MKPSRYAIPYIKRIHGNTTHCRRLHRRPEIKLRRDIERLKRELDAAVAAEEYENAAVLRDRIRELEGPAAMKWYERTDSWAISQFQRASG